MYEKDFRQKKWGSGSLKLLIGMAIILLVIGLCGCISQNPDDFYNEAQAFQNQGDYKSAIGTYDELIYLYPNYENISKIYEELPRCYFEWGEQLQNQGLYEDAILKYSVIIHSYPDTFYESEAVDRIIEIGELADTTSSIPSPDREYVGGNCSIVEMENDANIPVTLVFTGPTYESIKMEPGEFVRLEFNPGVYYLVGTADGVLPFKGIEDLTIGYKYSWVWYIETTY